MEWGKPRRSSSPARRSIMAGMNRPGPTIPDGSLDGGSDPSWNSPPPRVSRPSLAQGRPSQVRTAGSSGLVIAVGGCALLVVLGGIAALAIFLIAPRTFAFLDPDPPPRGGAPPSPPRRPLLPDAGARPPRCRARVSALPQARG